MDRYTGSRVSGDGYGYATITNGAGFGVVFTFGGRSVALGPCVDTFTDAYAKGERLAACVRAWRNVQARNAWLSASPNNAVIG
jgi:hypothetical protein